MACQFPAACPQFAIFVGQAMFTHTTSPGPRSPDCLSRRRFTARGKSQPRCTCKPTEIVLPIFQNKIWKLLPQETIKEEKAAILDASESDRESNTDTSESGKFPSFPLLVGPDPARSGNAKNRNVAKPFPSDDTLACSRLVKLNAWNLTPVFHPTLSSDLNQIFESYS